MTAEPIVLNKAGNRRGRGFSKEELKEAGLTVGNARDLGLYVDERRRTKHKENLSFLAKYLKSTNPKEVQRRRVFHGEIHR